MSVHSRTRLPQVQNCGRCSSGRGYGNTCSPLPRSTFIGDRYRVVHVGWNRVEAMLKPLGIAKVALLGRKTIESARKCMLSDAWTDAVAGYGHLGDYEYKGCTVPFYGLPITGITQDSIRFFAELRNGGS